MSYDVSLMIDTGAEDLSEVVDVGNMTCNVSLMWAKALGFYLSEMHGWLAKEAIPDLERAVAHMQNPANRELYEAMNPSNGWGDREGATQYLANLLHACRKHWKCIIHISHCVPIRPHPHHGR